VITIGLTTDGPHTPEYTRHVGNALAEAVRVLLYATLSDGLEYPSDAYTLLGALATATQRMPQLVGQLASFLEAQAAAGRLADDSGDEPLTLVRQAARELQDAAEAAGEMAASLREAQNVISGLAVKGDGDAS